MRQNKFTILTSIIIFLVSLLLIFLPQISQARGLVPCGGPGECPCGVTDIFVMIARVTNWLIAVAGIYAVFQIVGGGFWLVASLGNEESITKHKNQISQAVIGFVFVMAAYILVNTAINYILLSGAPANLKINLANPFTYLNSNSSSSSDTLTCQPGNK